MNNELISKTHFACAAAATATNVQHRTLSVNNFNHCIAWLNSIIRAELLGKENKKMISCCLIIKSEFMKVLMQFSSVKKKKIT